MVVLAAVLILTVINPNLTNFNLDGVTTIDRAPIIPSTTRPETAIEGCAAAAITCTSEVDTYGTRLSFNLEKSQVREFGNVVSGCATEGGTVIVTAEDSAIVQGYCYVLGGEEITRITDIFESAGASNVTHERLIKDFQRRIAPYNATSLPEGTIFDIPDENVSSYTRTICSRLGGDYNAGGIFGSRTTCTVAET